MEDTKEPAYENDHCRLLLYKLGSVDLPRGTPERSDPAEPADRPAVRPTWEGGVGNVVLPFPALA